MSLLWWNPIDWYRCARCDVLFSPVGFGFVNGVGVRRFVLEVEVVNLTYNVGAIINSVIAFDI
jgi:hypothetical protein